MADGRGETELWQLTATELIEHYARRTLSPVEVLESVWDRIDGLNPRVNAFVTLTPELAGEQARAAERLYGRGEGGEGGGGLLGVPVSIKDNLPTRGIRTTMGSLTLRDWVPDTDAVIVERVRAAGAVVLGKTNTCEFGWKGDAGNRLFGATNNPWRLDRTSGGSSGGAAAATAAGLGPLALGTDGAGSLRIPASFCGVVGYKPSQGTVPVGPRGGVGTLSHHGPIARTVRDIALVLAVAAGPDARDRLCDGRAGRDFALPADPDLRGVRVAWSPTLGYAHVEPEVLALVTDAVDALGDLGAHVEEVDLVLEDPHELAWMIFELAQATQHAGALEDVRGELDPGRLPLIDAALGHSALDLALAMGARDRLHQQMRVFMESWDVLVTPTLPDVAFAPGLDHPPLYGGAATSGFRWSPFTYPFNLTGQPAVSLPCGFLDELPVGVQIVGRWRDDESVLRVAAAFESARPWNSLAPLET
jgi:Asp-tRNA(Asn)/Glu-tRNA(Gln) amidotransferase A subunit family amidase